MVSPTNSFALSRTLASDVAANSIKDEISSSPYYLHPSDHLHHVLALILLNGDNYERCAKLT